MKTITITNEYKDTLRKFVEWFQEEFESTDRENQIVLKRLMAKLDRTEGTTESIEINETEIWFLRNYLQSAWQDTSCTVDGNALHELFDYIVEKDNGQTNS